MMAKLFLAVFAGKGCVRALRESLGITAHRNLPSQQQKQRHKKQTPGISVRYKYEGSEHHREIPVIYPAYRTATVFHHPHLKRTEKQNAYHIAHAVGKAYQYQDTLIYYPPTV